LISASFLEILYCLKTKYISKKIKPILNQTQLLIVIQGAEQGLHKNQSELVVPIINKNIKVVT
jgi:hypothetical protein